MSRQARAGGIALATLAVTGMLLSAQRDVGTARGMGPEVVHTVDCKSRMQVIPPKDHPGHISPEARRVSAFAGPVMFLGAKQYADEAFRPHRDGKDWRLKTPVYVKAGSPVTIAVDSPEDRELLLSIGLDRRGPQGNYEYAAEAIRLEPCNPDAKVAGRRVGRKTPFLGGFRFEGNTCVDVTVGVEDETEPHHTSFGFGRRNCTPGDRP